MCRSVLDLRVVSCLTSLDTLVLQVRLRPQHSSSCAKIDNPILHSDSQSAAQMQLLCCSLHRFTQNSMAILHTERACMAAMSMTQSLRDDCWKHMQGMSLELCSTSS